VSSAKKLTAAYIVKMTVYPRPQTAYSNKHLVASLNPQLILQAPIVCHHCGKVDNDMFHQEFVYCVDEAKWFCKGICSRVWHALLKDKP